MNDGEPMRRYAIAHEDPLPWCARFVRAGFAATGNKLPGNPWKLPSVKYMMGKLSGHMVDEPQPGDIVFFAWRMDSDDDPAGYHVGIVESIEADNAISTIEGNVGDAVARRLRKINGSVLGFARWRG